MRLGLNRWDWRTPAAFAAQTSEAEHLGFDCAFLPVNPLGAPDPYVNMAVAIQATERMVFGPLLESPVLRPAALAAGSIATVDALGPGRTMLTYGVGDTAVRWLNRRPARMAELEEAAVQARAYLAGERLDVGAQAPAWLRHARPVPVWIAAGGPKTLRMAGRVADGVFIRVGTHPANLRRAVDAIQSGAVEAGRDPGDVGIAVIVHTVTDQDPEHIRAVSRSMAAGYYEYSPTLFDAPGFEWNGPDIHELQDQVWPDFHHARDLVAAGALVDFLPDEVAASFSFHGSQADVADQLRSVVAAVPEVDIVVPHPVPMPAFDGIIDYVRWFGQGVAGVR